MAREQADRHEWPGNPGAQMQPRRQRLGNFDVEADRRHGAETLHFDAHVPGAGLGEFELGGAQELVRGSFSLVALER